MRLVVATIPNGITMMRVLLIPFIYLAMAREWTGWLALLVLCVGLSDLLDGWVARRFRQVSDLGKLLDPAADKICALALSLALVLYTAFPLWAMLVIWGKDLFIATGGFFISRRAKLPITPNFWGKATALLELLVFGAYACGVVFLQRDLLFVMTGFAVVSFIIYIRIFARVISGRHTVAEIVSSYSSYGLNRSSSAEGRRMNRLIYLLCVAMLLRLIWLVTIQLFK